MKHTLSFIVSALALFAFLIGCDQTTSSNSSGDSVSEIWKLDSITLNDSTIAIYSLQYSTFAIFTDSTCTKFSYTSDIDSATVPCFYKNDSLYVIFEEDTFCYGHFSNNEGHIEISFSNDEDTNTIFYSPYHGKYPPNEWFIMPNNDPKIINTSWICDSMISSGITVKMDSTDGILYTFTENVLTIHQVFYDIINSYSQRYNTENNVLYVEGNYSANYQIDGNQLKLIFDGYETTYYLTSYDGDTIPDNWRNLERSTAQIKNKSPFIPALLENIKH